jgi:uncharacterized protein YraI
MDDNSSQGRRRRVLAVLAALTAAAWVPGALAIPARVIATAHLRAGPGTAYPVVAVMGTGTPVELFGCEQGYGWCDVQAGPSRGWVDAYLLQSDLVVSGTPVLIVNGAATLGVPLITFTFGSYWDTYYRGRPWYANRAYYYSYWNRYPHGRPPPVFVRPPVRPPPPPARPLPPQPRPPGNARPPGGKPPPPGNTRPPGGKPPPPSTRPAPAQ